MQLIGHELVPYEKLYFCTNTDEIDAKLQNMFYFNSEMIRAAQEKGAKFSVACENVSECIIANAAGANLLVMSRREFTPKAANLAQFYLFDANVACIIGDEIELSEIAGYQADVAIFDNAIVWDRSKKETNGTF